MRKRTVEFSLILVHEPGYLTGGLSVDLSGGFIRCAEKFVDGGAIDERAAVKRLFRWDVFLSSFILLLFVLAVDLSYAH